MRLWLISLAWLASVVLPVARATVLSYQLSAYETACFYEAVPSAPRKVYFYYAVQSSDGGGGSGSYALDISVRDASGRVVLQNAEAKDKAQGDYVFTAETVGDFAFCLVNANSGSGKTVEFDISVESDVLAESKKDTNAAAQSKSEPEFPCHRYGC